MADNSLAGTLLVTGNVGIGTEPSLNAQLYIKSTSAASQVFLESGGGTLLKLNVDNSGASLGTDNPFPLNILTDGSPRLSIDKSGNIGIGISPTLTEKLSVNGNIKVTGDVGISGSTTIGNTLRLQTGGEINEISSDITGSISDRAVPTNKAVKTYVDSALAIKAALAGSPTQDFAANNLTVQNKLTVIGNLDVTGDLELGDGDADRVRIHGVVNSTHSSGTLQIGSPLKVTGSVTADRFIGDGSGLTGLVGTTQWSNGASGSIYYNNGNVGIGTSAPLAKLEVNGDIKWGNSRLRVDQGGSIELGANNLTPGQGTPYIDFHFNGLTQDYNTRIINDADGRLSLVAGGVSMTGSLVVNGDIRAGNSDIYFTKTDHNHTGIGNAAGWAAIENAADPYNALMILGRGGTPKGRSVKLWDYLQVNGDLDVTGNITGGSGIQFPNTGGGLAKFTNQKFNNENSFKNNNIKLTLGNTGPFYVINQPPLEYEFVIGHTDTILGQGNFGTLQFYTNFIKRFSINQKGDAYFAGAKTGFVTDYFVNRVGDTLEQGDVVVISKYQISHYSGTQNNIPILEVDLTDRAGDTRVCGIVAKFVTEQDLPFTEVEPEAETSQPEQIEQIMSEATESLESYPHPLKLLAPEFKEGADPTKVQDQQMGLMVTLGAFAHCKVDADIAPIVVGDLLTTSPTRGHAQKVVEPAKAVGAIVGKALASLEKGKGKIPVLVMLQ